MFIATATANSPYTWPMDSDPTFVAKTSDYYTNTALVDPVLAAKTIPSTATSSQVDFNIAITGDALDPAGAYVVNSAVLVSVPAVETGLSFTVVNGTTVRIQGGLSGMTGEYYRFLLRDRTLANLSPSNTEDWVAITKWNPPPTPWEKVGVYTFTVNYDFTDAITMVPLTNQTATFEVIQYSYWNYTPALAAFKQLVLQGEF